MAGRARTKTTPESEMHLEEISAKLSRLVVMQENTILVLRNIEKISSDGYQIGTSIIGELNKMTDILS